MTLRERDYSKLRLHVTFIASHRRQLLTGRR